MTSEVAGYQARGMKGRREVRKGGGESGGKLDAGGGSPPHSYPGTRLARSCSFAVQIITDNYLRVGINIYIRGVYFLIHVSWRFVVY